jgi:hypothetical protein
VVLAAAAAGCSSSHQSATKPLVATTTLAHPRCGGATVAPAVRHLASTTGSVWVWIESAARPAVRVGSLVKVVWRITGTGAPQVVLSNPHGRAAHLAFGPERHAKSTFLHPGDEYGTGFTPTLPGCWQLTMRRGNVIGSLWFLVDG